MLRVTIELVPFGDEDEKEIIEQMVIANTGTEDHGYFGKYEYAVADSKGRHPIVYGDVPQHVRAHGAWALVQKILEQRVVLDSPLTDTQKQLAERLTK